MINLENPTRNHWIAIGKEIVSSIYEFFIIIILIATKLKWIYLIPLGILLLVFSIVKWRKTVFYIKDNMLFYEKGIFSKTREQIPFNKITTVDMEQGPISRILKLCTLKVDTGAALDIKAEVKITVKLEVAEEVKKEILKNKELDSDINIEEKNYIEATFKDLMVYALTKNKLGWILGAYVIFNQVKDFVSESIIDSLNNNAEKIVTTIGNKIFNKQSVLFITFYILIIFLICYIIAATISIIKENIQYHNFKLYKNKNKLNLEYGLFTKKRYSFPIKKIQAIKLKQTAIQQLLGLYTLEAVIIGYGDNDDKKAIIYPIANEKLKNKIIEQFLPKFKFDGQIYKPRKRHLLKFITKRTLINLGISIFILYFIHKVSVIWKIGLVVILSLIQIILGYINYKNTLLGVSKENIIMSSGSITKITHLIKENTVQSISKVQNPFQRFSKVCTYKIDICTNLFGEVVTVKHLNENLINTLENNIEL